MLRTRHGAAILARQTKTSERKQPIERGGFASAQLRFLHEKVVFTPSIHGVRLSKIVRSRKLTEANIHKCAVSVNFPIHRSPGMTMNHRITDCEQYLLGSQNQLKRVLERDASPYLVFLPSDREFSLIDPMSKLISRLFFPGMRWQGEFFTGLAACSGRMKLRLSLAASNL